MSPSAFTVNTNIFLPPIAFNFEISEPLLFLYARYDEVWYCFYWNGTFHILCMYLFIYLDYFYLWVSSSLTSLTLASG